MTQSEPSVRLRRFPFPFRAALSICSDIDECDRGTFLAVHRFLNDPREGLGLPVADSFFPLGREPGQMAYFLGDGRTPGPDAELIVEALRAGLIDSIHSWGDFNGTPPDPSNLRATAERLTDDFLRLGLKVEVWINHGDPNNRQNLQARLQAGYRGDDPNTGYYTTDLARQLGVRYYWWSELVSWPLSCGRRTLRESCLRPGTNALKNLVKLMLGRRDRLRTAAELEELVLPVTLKDGHRILAFTRHLRGLREPSSRHTLHYHLTVPILQELLAREGYLVLYTHLGMPRPDRGELFAPGDRQALEHLAETYHGGKIWVAPTGRLLRYRVVTENLSWEAHREGDVLFIDLRSVNDPVDGPRPPLLHELDGLCFYIPSGCGTIIRLSDRELMPKIYGRDYTGGWVVGLDPHPPPDTSLLKEFR